MQYSVVDNIINMYSVVEPTGVCETRQICHAYLTIRIIIRIMDISSGRINIKLISWLAPCSLTTTASWNK